MIDYGHFQFAAAPRTGTTWFMKAMHLAGFKEGSKAHVHLPFDKDGPDTFRISLARNPADWLRSYWQEIRGGSIGYAEFDVFRKLPRSDFPSFVRVYLRKMPGAVGELIKSYEANSYLRIEDMPWALAETLEAFEVSSHRRATFYGLKAENTSRKLPVMTPTTRQKILQAEREMAEMFDYV